MRSLRDGCLFEAPWGISAVGSASHWQCGGQGFKSPMLHQKKYGTLLCFVLFYFSKSMGDLKGEAQRTAQCAVRPSHRSARRRASPLCSTKKSTEHFCVSYFFYFSKSIGGLKGEAQRTAHCAVRPSHRSARRRASPLCSTKKVRNTFVFRTFFIFQRAWGT